MSQCRHFAAFFRRLGGFHGFCSLAVGAGFGQRKAAALRWFGLMGKYRDGVISWKFALYLLRIQHFLAHGTGCLAIGGTLGRQQALATGTGKGCHTLPNMMVGRLVVKTACHCFLQKLLGYYVGRRQFCP